MRQNLLLSVLLIASASAAARAQVAEVYVTSANVHVTNVPSGSAGNPLTTRYDTFWASGVGGGVTVNFLPLPIVSLGFDLRGSTKPGTTGADTAMVGLKLGVHPPIIRIKPYIQGSVGYVAARTPSAANGSSLTNKYLAYEVFGGIDYPLAHFIDFRVIEIGGGGVISSGSSNSPGIFNIDTGLVIHF
jgi:hypothetical protein